MKVMLKHGMSQLCAEHGLQPGCAHQCHCYIATLMLSCLDLCCVLLALLLQWLIDFQGEIGPHVAVCF